MFNSKKTNLFEGASKTMTSENAFIKAGLGKAAETLSENSALKYSTTGSDFVDQFGKMGMYKEPRKFEDISRDVSLLYSQDKATTVKLTLFMRMITRFVDYIDGSKSETTQRGSGLKHESIMRFLWLGFKDKSLFTENLPLFVAAGSWRDIFEMMRYDLMYHGWDNRVLDWEFLAKFIIAGLENPSTTHLVKKYMPHQRARSKGGKQRTVRSQANIMIAKFLGSKMGVNYKTYRQLKTSGEAHTWQKLLSQKLFDKIDFDTIHGRALAQMVSSKFIKNQGLEAKYQEWIESKPIAKFTGYPHELFERYAKQGSKYGWGNALNVDLSNISRYQELTINKQFAGLVETAKKNMSNQSRFIVARDTSGSMCQPANGSKLACGDIAKSLALYFSELLDGPFKDTWIEFDNRATMKKWTGQETVDKWRNDRSGYVGGTNFQDVIDLICRLKRQGVSESDFPTGILCISDGEFNPSALGRTNVETAMSKLWNAGFSKEYVENFKIVLWNLSRGNTNKFESYGETENVFYFSGYDGAIIAFLMGVEKADGTVKQTPKTDVELFEAAMDQELLNKVIVK